MSSRTAEIFLTCCLEGNARVVERILKKNRKSWTGIINNNSFDVNCVDSSSRTGLSLACISNHKDVVDLLLSRADLDVNKVDIFGASALMYASKNLEGKEVVGLLLERKDLDLDEKDQDGKTAEDYATEENNEDAVTIIRDERSKRMGGVWKKPETIISEFDPSDIEDSDESEQNNEHETLNISQNIKEDNEIVEEMFVNQEDSMDGDEFVRKEFIDKLNERIAKENNEIRKKENIYIKNMEILEKEFQERKTNLQDTFLKEKEKSNLLVSKLQTTIENFDMKRILDHSSSYSELECPVCLEEMKPPMRIWQCLSGHPVCELCRKSPRVKDCPTCRQSIVGRNTLAEKLAKSLYGNE